MKLTLSTTHAADILLHDENANWSPRGSYRLVEWYEELEDETGEEIELDCVAIRCDWNELTEDELRSEYDYLFEDSTDECLDAIAEILDYLNDRTVVIVVDQYDKPNTYLVQAF
jgi:hypothetical protein